MLRKIKYFVRHWKLGIHLLLRTKRFGVNNEWWSHFDSPFGHSFGKILWNVISIRGLMDNYRCMKFRAVACHFMSDEEKEIMGWK